MRGFLHNLKAGLRACVLCGMCVCVRVCAQSGKLVTH